MTPIKIKYNDKIYNLIYCSNAQEIKEAIQKEVDIICFSYFFRDEENEKLEIKKILKIHRNYMFSSYQTALKISITAKFTTMRFCEAIYKRAIHEAVDDILEKGEWLPDDCEENKIWRFNNENTRKYFEI